MSTSERWIGPVSAVAMIAILLGPRLTHLSQILLALTPALVLWRHNGLSRLLPLPPIVAALAVFGAYLLINAAWAVDQLEAYVKVAYFWWLIAITALAVRGLSQTDEEHLRRMLGGALVGLAIGGLILAVETIFNQPLRRFLINVFPWMRGPAKHLIVSGDVVTGIGLYTLNRNLALLSLALWPAVLMLRRFLSIAAWRIAAVGAVTLTTIVVFSSEHETSMLAVAFSLAAFIGMLVAPRIMRGVILAGWLVASLAVVPIAAISYDAGLHKSQSIPITGRNRIILWGVTADEIAKTPVFGIGVGSTKELDELAGPAAVKPADHSYPLRTGRHAHNMFMQTWYELGAVGALLFAGVGFFTLQLFRRLPEAQQPYAYASFVSAVMIAAFSWGMWQTWFMAAFAIWAMLLAMALDLTSRTTEGARGVAGDDPTLR